MSTADSTGLSPELEEFFEEKIFGQLIKYNVTSDRLF
jgi:hypothetical protein